MDSVCLFVSFIVRLCFLLTCQCDELCIVCDDVANREQEEKKNLIFFLTMHVPHHLGAIQLNPSMKTKCHLPLSLCVTVFVWSRGESEQSASLLGFLFQDGCPPGASAAVDGFFSDRGLDRFFYLVGTIRNTKERPRLSVRCSFYYRLTPQTPAAQLAASRWRRFTALTTPALAPERIVVQNTAVSLSHL